MIVSGWLFFATPLKNDGVRQLGWWHSQYIWKVIIHSCYPSVIALFSAHTHSAHRHLVKAVSCTILSFSLLSPLLLLPALTPLDSGPVLQRRRDMGGWHVPLPLLHISAFTLTAIEHHSAANTVSCSCLYAYFAVAVCYLFIVLSYSLI